MTASTGQRIWTNAITGQKSLTDPYSTPQPAAATSPPAPAAPLPAGWAMATDPTGKPYYYNGAGQSQWDPPGSLPAPAAGPKAAAEPDDDEIP